MAVQCAPLVDIIVVVVAADLRRPPPPPPPPPQTNFVWLPRALPSATYRIGARMYQQPKLANVFLAALVGLAFYQESLLDAEAQDDNAADDPWQGVIHLSLAVKHNFNNKC
ncbi:hypothetical protein IF1G_04662 [Cordyceps javanica]|uniref:Uncharacterized protein n=1 Tax=Cordyceps javanica TaxID=43265 RepID=A0A545W073_9HYPO|nr:hypothetical protein IF1G_04662 [Cordyceps javanica]TQW07372.1 hypothetical protein IF2G_04533 [Cordyceps javanica]